MGRKPYEKDVVLDSLREFAEREGRPPTLNEWRKRALRPSIQAITYHFGGWNGAMAAAGLEIREQGSWIEPDDNQYFELLDRVQGGESLAKLGRELGCTGQALGRKLQRLRNRYGIA